MQLNGPGGVKEQTGFRAGLPRRYWATTLPGVTTSPRTRQRQRQRPLDLTYLRSQPGYRENPGLLATALKLGAYVKCSRCPRVVGVGLSRADAGSEALKEGTAIRKSGGFRCHDHSKDK